VPLHQHLPPLHTIVSGGMGSLPKSGRQYVIVPFDPK